MTRARWSPLAPRRFVAGVYTVADEATFFSTGGGGSFPAWDCVASEARPLIATLYFFSFVIATALLIISLFVSVITMGMLEALDAQKQLTQDVMRNKVRPYAVGTGQLHFRPASPSNHQPISARFVKTYGIRHVCVNLPLFAVERLV